MRDLDSGRISEKWSITAAVTTVEAHLLRLIEELISSSAVSFDRFGLALLDAQKADITRSWTSRFDWLDRGFGISIKSGQHPVQEMLLVIDLRNSIVHGDGYLTDYQSEKLSNMIGLRNRLQNDLHVHFLGRELVVGLSTARVAIDICISFVRHLDGVAIAAYPKLEAQS